MMWGPYPAPEGDVPFQQDYGSRPGKPTWGPYMTHEQAKEHERKLTQKDPLGALAWDRKADLRQQAWEASPFATSVNRLDIQPGSIVVP